MLKRKLTQSSQDAVNRFLRGTGSFYRKIYRRLKKNGLVQLFLHCWWNTVACWDGRRAFFLLHQRSKVLITTSVSMCSPDFTPMRRAIIKFSQRWPTQKMFPTSLAHTFLTVSVAGKGLAFKLSLAARSGPHAFQWLPVDCWPRCAWLGQEAWPAMHIEHTNPPRENQTLKMNTMRDLCVLC